MIEVRYLDRLGNNLFQYCLGRILAENLGFALQAKGIPGFPHTNAIWDGGRYRSPLEVLSGHRIDLGGILTNRQPRRIVLNGYFQCHEYYRAYRASIREWLAFDTAIRVPEVASSAVVLHVRRTDYVQFGWALPFSFYESALQHLKPGHDDVWIVTDDRRDPFFRRFAPWKPNFISGSGLEEMLFMTKAPRLVMSQSTFSWWPTFLGDHREVVCPLSLYGAWSKTGRNQSASEASLIERDRFTCLECHEHYTPTISESLYQEMRLLRRNWIVRINRWLRLSLLEPMP
jgi:hypothetical protein